MNGISDEALNERGIGLGLESFARNSFAHQWQQPLVNCRKLNAIHTVELVEARTHSAPPPLPPGPRTLARTVLHAQFCMSSFTRVQAELVA